MSHIESNVASTTVTVQYFPSGGSTGQALIKSSGSNYAVAWGAPYFRNAATSGALATTSAWVSTTAKQIDATQDRYLTVAVTLNATSGAAATCAFAISPDNSTYTTLGTETQVAAASADAGDIRLIGLHVPAAWYVKLTFANATVAPGTYY